MMRGAFVLFAALALGFGTGSARAADEEPGQGKLYVTSWFGGVVTVVDVASRRVTARVPVGVQDHNVVLNPDQTQAWVTNSLFGPGSCCLTSRCRTSTSF